MRRYPDFSFKTGSGIILISSENFIICSKYSFSVLDCAIISAVLFFQMELAKCRDKNFSGLPVNFANFEGSSVEELVTITVFSGSNGAKLL